MPTVPKPRAHDMALGGNGQSEIEDYLDGRADDPEPRDLSPDPEPEKGGFFRSDHFSLARTGHSRHQPGGGTI